MAVVQNEEAIPEAASIEAGTMVSFESTRERKLSSEVSSERREKARILRDSTRWDPFG